MTADHIEKVVERIRYRISHEMQPDMDDVLRVVEELEKYRRYRNEIGFGKPEWWGKGTGD